MERKPFKKLLILILVIFMVLLATYIPTMDFNPLTYEVKGHSSSNYYTFTMEVMGENYTIAIETDGTIENFGYTNFTFGWDSVGCSFYNITIPKSLNNTKILARSYDYQGTFEPDEILMNATHYFVYYSDPDIAPTISDIFFGAPNVKISISSTTSYIGFQVDIKVNVTYRGKPWGNWPAIVVAYTAPLKGDVWAWQWMNLPLTLIGMGNTTQDGIYSVVWMPTANGTWWISAGLAPFWPATDGDYPEEASDALSLNVIPHDEAIFSVVSNSTISELTFNSTNMELYFSVEGLSGTTGFVDVFISKTLLENPNTLEIYVNGTQLGPEDYTINSLDNSWLLHFEITFASKYDVSIIIPEFSSSTWMAMFVMFTVLAISYVKKPSKPTHTN